MRAYPIELRKRIFDYSLIHTIKETAQVFNVSPNTVFLLKKKYFETGDLKPSRPKRSYTRIITEEGTLFIRELITEQPGITLNDLGSEYEKVYGIRPSIGTLFNTIKELGITRKKKPFSDPRK